MKYNNLTLLYGAGQFNLENVMRTLVLAFLLLSEAIGYSQTQQNDFRGFTWGDSWEKIRAAEKAKFVTKKDKTEVEYKDALGGKDIRILYVFNEENKLVHGVYIFAKKYNNPELYVLNYNAFSNLLTEKYGNPAKQKERWNSSDVTNDKANPGQAVLDGDLSLYTVWITDRTVIKSTLINEDGKPSMQIHYTTRSLDELENKEELRSALEKL